VRWILEHLPLTVKPIFNHCIPTLPFPDASVDLISAFSVFTHIDTFETHWLAELRRILSPKGICYLTVHNEDTWNLLAGEINNKNNRLVQSMLAIDPSLEQQLQEPMPKSRLVYRFAQSGPYRAQVFHSNEYLHRVWGRFFEILEIKPAYHNRQTVLILRKA
jgi:ubiquinone/menaquinone biosynthesis C-methylase UbiE